MFKYKMAGEKFCIEFVDFKKALICPKTGDLGVFKRKGVMEKSIGYYRNVLRNIKKYR